MKFQFSMATGSHADTKELEYIAALMQTCRPLRQDGSIDGTCLLQVVVVAIVVSDCLFLQFVRILFSSRCTTQQSKTLNCY
jgi:hypothetical protein